MPFKNKAERAAYDKAYVEKNRERKDVYNANWRLANADHLKQRAATRRIEKRAMCMIAAARVRARKKNIPFALDGFSDVLQARINKGVCEMSGVPLDLSPGRKPTSPSLDRKDPKKGYTIDNVRILCHALNAALGDWGEDSAALIMRAWLANRDQSIGENKHGK